MKRFPAILILAVALLCFWGAAMTHLSFMHERTLHRADYAPPLEDMSPLMAFSTVALGGFRGIIADLLWLRCIELQAEGRFFELAQLADWITKLEPHFVQVWAFHAWNMAYNISNLFPYPEDRWRWVQHGIQLLRDDGLKLNPRHPEMYWELAWLYLHKIGFVMDSTHWYYKIRLATDIQDALDGEDPCLEDFIPTRRFLDEYKFCPRILQTINNDYGPFDWRHPAAHAFYWAYRGRELAPDPHSARAEGALFRAAIHCERTILQSISKLFRQGNLFVEPEAGLFIATPRFELLPRAIDTFEEILARYDIASFHMRYAHFLANASLILYCYGQTADAESLFAFLLEKYPLSDPDPGFEDFIREAVNQDISDMDYDIAMAMVEGALFQACLQEIAGDDSHARALIERAERIWADYMNSRVSEDHLRRTGLPPLQAIYGRARERAAALQPARARETKKHGEHYQ